MPSVVNVANYYSGRGRCPHFSSPGTIVKTNLVFAFSWVGTITNIPSGMLTDQFGMVGLLTFIRTAENDPSLVALAPGIDLTTLGLNLNQPE